MLCKLIAIRIRALLGRTFVSTEKKGIRILLAIVLPYCIITFGALFFFMFYSLAETLCGTPFAWFYFALVSLMSFGISFFFTAFTAKGELFEAKDNELLFSLPIHPRTILLSRLSLLLVAEYLFSLLVMLPAGIAWAIFAGVSFLPLYILGCLSFPLLTAALASIVGWLLALLTARVRHKNLLTIIFSLLFLGLYFYVYTNMQNYVNQILASYEQFSDSLMGWGFLFHWFGRGIADTKILSLLSVIGIAVAAFALAVWILSHGFLRITSAKPVHKEITAAPNYVATSVRSALLKREFKRLLSCPTYMLNCGLGLILLIGAPIYLLIKPDTIVALLASFDLSELQIAFLGALAVSAIAGTCYFSAPSISLEGKTLWILRSAPIDAKQILHAKISMHLSLTTLPVLFASAVLAYILKCSVTGIIILLIIPQLFNLLNASFGLVLNLLCPKFDWTNEAVPVKQGLPVTLTMLTMMLLPMVLIVGGLYLDIPAKIFILASICVLTAAIIPCLLWLEKKGAGRFDRL